ncbi:MAG: hypothetical protein EXR58_05240 [Chloroflexi bacterium]|nr:hypothetical protein [Chloroflexota bacterium]
MRMMVRFSFAGEEANDLIRSGEIAKVLQMIMEDLKPEAAYFYPEGGDRAGMMVVDMKESSQLAEIAEPFFMGLNATVEMTPVMTAEDLQKGMANMQRIVDKYG